jgi:hypothetical protein
MEGIVQFARDSALRGNAFGMDDLLAIIRQTNKVVEKGSSIHQGRVSISELNNSTLG